LSQSLFLLGAGLLQSGNKSSSRENQLTLTMKQVRFQGYGLGKERRPEVRSGHAGFCLCSPLN